MPIFYFDIVEQNGSITRDEMGMHFPTVDDALTQASVTFAEMVAAEARFNSSLRINVWVRDQDGNQIASRTANISTWNTGDT